ncbi:3-(3-hydroxy-phenyl)propionate/3-hydroxycinnamic acid hydroxylase [Streptomyces griseomycini]
MNTDVLVVGAGPTGLTLGIDLARRGVDALVVERADGLFPGSRGKGLQPRTMEVFDDLGVLDAIHAAGGGYPVGMVWRNGERVGEHRMFDPVETSEDAPYNEPWMVPQWRTQEILLARLEELGGKVVLGREVVGVAQDAEGVTAHLASGETVRARYAVAADGGRSVVRRAVGVGMTGEEVDPNPTLVADVRVPGLDRDNWHVSRRATAPTTSWRSARWPGRRTPLVARFAEGTDVDLSPDGVRRVVAARSHLAPEDVTEVRWASDFRPGPRSPTASARAGCSSPATRRTCTPRRADRFSTPVSRTPTTWAGSSARCCATGRTRPCWTPTRRSGARSPRTCSACRPACTAARCGAGRPPRNWAWATGSRP